MTGPKSSTHAQHCCIKCVSHKSITPFDQAETGAPGSCHLAAARCQTAAAGEAGPVDRVTEEFTGHKIHARIVSKHSN